MAARVGTNPLRQKNPLRKSASPGEIRFALRNPLRLKLICRKSASPDADWSDADCPDALKIDVLLTFFKVLVQFGFTIDVLLSFFNVFVPKSMFC